jgi:ribosomal protein L32E
MIDDDNGRWRIGIEESESCLLHVWLLYSEAKMRVVMKFLSKGRQPALELVNSEWRKKHKKREKQKKEKKKKLQIFKGGFRSSDGVRLIFLSFSYFSF